MKRFAALLSAVVLCAPTLAAAQVEISRGGSRTVRTPPPDNFTGSVRVEMLFEALDPSHASGGYVTFEPRARTAWHSHPRGQILIVTAGIGRVQQWGGPIDEIRAGDVVRIPAGQKHWHGASPQSAMTHLAVSEHRDGTSVEWMERVTDQQYEAAAGAPQGASRPSGARQQALAPGLAVAHVALAAMGADDQEPPTFVVVGEQDGIASPSVMERRVAAVRATGAVVELHPYPRLGHGFGPGIGTRAEGWIDRAVDFWEKVR
jgi:quercetin dioxygenase-like cupin family protein